MNTSPIKYEPNHKRQKKDNHTPNKTQEKITSLDRHEDYNCNICLELPRHVKESSCGHIICKSCLNKQREFLKTQKRDTNQCYIHYTCNICRESSIWYDADCQPNGYHHSKFIQRKINEIAIKKINDMNEIELQCPHPRCNLKIKRKHLSKHIKECDKRIKTITTTIDQFNYRAAARGDVASADIKIIYPSTVMIGDPLLIVIKSIKQTYKVIVPDHAINNIIMLRICINSLPEKYRKQLIQKHQYSEFSKKL